MSSPTQSRRLAVPIKRGRAVVSMLLLALAAFAGAVSPSTAATTPGYPTALVEPGYATRTQPWIRSDTLWGYALQQPGGGRQTVSVTCWYDGSWANIGYNTNRWFKVLVWENWDGYGTPRWLFMHASLVYNQPTVRRCNATSTGYW